MSNESSIWGQLNASLLEGQVVTSEVAITQPQHSPSTVQTATTSNTPLATYAAVPRTPSDPPNLSVRLERRHLQRNASYTCPESSETGLFGLSLNPDVAVPGANVTSSALPSSSSARTRTQSNLNPNSQNPLNPNPSVIVDGEINHFLRLSQDLAALYLNQELSDVCFVVGGEKFVGHRVILASRSEYFRVLLFGSFKESQSSVSEFVIEDTTAQAFGALLKYIYTGKLAICEYSEPDVLEILGLAHKYRFELLEESISSYLKISLTVENACLIYDDSLLYNLTTLTTICKEFLDKNASEVMRDSSFLNLSLSAICELIDRDSFYAPELEIFNAVYQWQIHYISQWEEASQESRDVQKERVKQVIKKLRLTLISQRDLLEIVRPSGLFTAEEILDAIKYQLDKSDLNRKYRGCVLFNENVALREQNASVIQGDIKDRLLDSQDHQVEFVEVSHNVRHSSDEQREGVIIKLGKHYIINTIKLLLAEKDYRSYSYAVEVSVDKEDWIRVCDYTKYACRSWQVIHFEPRVLMYIRVFGVHNNVANKSFSIDSIRCLFSSSVQQLNKDGFICPSENVASTRQFASVVEGVSRSRNALINGDTDNYDWDMGYTCHQLGSGSIVIQLCQPFCLSSMRMLLWDCDSRAYSYFIEVSNDQKHWTRICDRTKEDCRGWQYASFDPVVATFIKLVGTRNTANEVFHVVHFETPAITFSSEEERRSLLAGETTFLNVTLNPNL